MKALVFVDGSESSFKAVEHAIQLALKEDAELTFLHVFPPRLDRDIVSQFEIEPEDLDDNYAREVLSRVKKMLDEARVEADLRYKEGPIAEVIVSESGRGSFDVIMLGGRPRMAGTLFDVADVVRRKSSLPVEVIL